MRNIFQYKKFDVVIMLSLIFLWLVSFKSSALFNFFGTYSSLWYLPAGITLSITLAVPPRFIIAPLIANWLLAVPIVSNLLQIEYTSVTDHLFHGTRLFAIYAGAGLLVRYVLKIKLPISNLSDQLKIISITLIASLCGAASGVSLHVAMGSFDWAVARDIFLPWMIGDGIASMIVPPLLVPLLMLLFGPEQHDANPFPKPIIMLLQLSSIVVAMYAAFKLPADYPSLGPLWYVIVLPSIISAVTGGIPAAATSIAITALLVPPLATYFGYDGEHVSLQFLLLIGASVSLMIGGAISDRNYAFKVIKRHEEELEDQVADRTDQLQRAYEFQQHLVRSIGHDVRQPLYAVNNMLIGMSLANEDDKLVGPMQHTMRMGETAYNITQRILDYAKREAGKVEVVNEQFAVQSVFDQAADMFEFELVDRRVNLKVHPTDLTLVSDEHLVLEVISNLIQNSIRLSNAGDSVELKAKKTIDGIAITITDQVTSDDDPSGEAGFGLEIIRQISLLLEFEHVFEPNMSMLFFKK